MFFFGLEGSGFIISLALTLLISGAIMFYCLKRFNVLENSMIEQSKVLQSFIIRAQQGAQQGGQVQMPVHTATETAIKSAKMQSSNYEQCPIEVSDDDDGDDDCDTDSYATSDSDETSERIIYSLDTDYSSALQTEELPVIKLETTQFETLDELPINESLSDSSPTVKVIAMQDMASELLKLNLDNESDDSNSDSEADNNDNVDNEDNDNLITKGLNIETLPVELLDQENDPKKPAFAKLRVGHLRKLVVERGDVETIDAASKLKKHQLLQMLQSTTSAN